MAHFETSLSWNEILQKASVGRIDLRPDAHLEITVQPAGVQFALCSLGEDGYSPDFFLWLKPVPDRHPEVKTAMAASRGIFPWIMLTPVAVFGLIGLGSQVYGLAKGASPGMQLLLYVGLVGIYLLVHWLVFFAGKGKALREVGPVIEKLLHGKLVS